jgi:hypothetical protein
MFGDGFRGGDFFWYGPGAVNDTVWDYVLGRRVQAFPDPVRGFHVPVPGDYFGDGQDDVLWMNDNQPVLWDNSGASRFVYLLTPPAPASPASASAASAVPADAKGLGLGLDLGAVHDVAATDQQPLHRDGR